MSRLLTWRSSFGHPRSRHEELLEGHPFVQQVELFIPQLSAPAGTPAAPAPQSMPSAAAVVAGGGGDPLATAPFYHRFTAPLAALLDPDFVESTVLRGDFRLLACNAPLDAGGAVGAALLPGGTLCLSLSRDVHGQLGFGDDDGGGGGDGGGGSMCRVSAFCRRGSKRARPHLRYTVRVALADARYRRGGARHARLLACAGRLRQPIEWVCCWSVDGVPREPQLPPGATAGATAAATMSPSGSGSGSEEPSSDAGSEDGAMAGCGAGARDGEGGGATRRVAVRHEVHRFSRLALPLLLLPPPPVGDAATAAAAAAAAAAAVDTEETERSDAQMLSLFDWLGAVACRAEAVVAPPSSRGAACAPFQDPFVCGLRWESLGACAAADTAAAAAAAAAATVGGASGRSERWRGLLPPALPRACLARARAAVASGGAPWAALMVWGVPDAPVSWRRPPQRWQRRRRAERTGQKAPAMPAAAPAAPAPAEAAAAAAAAAAPAVEEWEEHGFEAGGEHHFVLVVLPGDRYWAFVALGAHDTSA